MTQTTFSDVIKAAIPIATEEVCDYILWGRTPFPMGKVTAKSLYKAASGYRRAAAHKIRLCEFCDRKAMPGRWVCYPCGEAIKRVVG